MTPMTVHPFCLAGLVAGVIGLGGMAEAATPAASASPAAAPPAAPDLLTPDRPGFTNGSDTVVPGRVQVELGLTGTTGSADSGTGRTTDGPQALIRAGLTPKLEARIILPDYLWPSGGQSGFGDGGVGVRYKFYQSKDGNTKLSLTPTLSVPVRSAVTTSGHVDPSLSLNGQTTSGVRWSLSSNLVLSYPTIAGRRVTDYTVTGAVSYQITSPLAAYLDVYDDLPNEGPPSSIGDGGVTYRLTPNLQLDLETGRGLGGAAPVQFYGGGVALRF